MIAGGVRVELLSPKTHAAALRYLRRSPYLNVFITHVILRDAPPRRREDVIVAIGVEGVRGVAYCGRQVVIAAESDALDPLAEYVRRHRGEQMIVGSRDTVVAFWKLIEHWHVRPRLVRDRQLVMVVDRERLRPYRGGMTVRHARMEEAAAVADGSAQMVRHELGVDTANGSADFVASVRRMIERKLWWVGIAADELCFFCNIGPWCDRTVQLQGIWTPPALRGRGHATAALAAICDRLLAVSPTVSLYVNDFNDPALALYRRVGFEPVGEFQTILF